MDELLTKPVELDAMARAIERWVIGDEAVGVGARGGAEEASAAAAGGDGVLKLPTPDGAVLDRDQLEEACMGDPGLRRVLVQTFLSDVPGRLAHLGGRIAAGDARAVEFDAHGLKGMCGALGAVRCADLFGAIEAHGHDGELSGTAELFAVVEGEVGRVEGVLAPLLNAAAPDAA